MPSLLTIKGYNMGVRYPLEEETTTIGRGPESTIQLLDDNVSRLHAEIRRDRLAYTVADKGSRNGIFVNGKKVEEKLLRRNDEIVIGSTHFLFDSDFELKNALFSNKSVYMSASADETIYSTVEQERIEALDDYQRGGLRLLERVSNLIATREAELPTISHEILSSILELTGARRAAVMRWDPAASELVPLAAECDEEQLTLNRAIVQQVFHERRAILTSDVSVDLRYAENPESPSRAASVICVPLGTDTHCDGVLYVDSDERDRFSLRDVGMMMAVGRLFYLAVQVARLHDRYESVSSGPAKMIGDSAAIRMVRDQAARIAEHDTPVLITGETGTGKELLAREVHALSPRRDGPFVAINCSAIPETLFESELFGYEKGAFTGAVQLTRGKIEVASGGTLFLDEIGEMSLAVQPKILRFLQNQIFYRVGGTRPIHSNVRILAATNTELRSMVEQGRFRADLMFRLNVVELHLAALRERRDDIPLLIDAFLKRFAGETKKPVRGVSEDALNYLIRYQWPGNIRELANCLERAVLLSDRPMLDVADFAPYLGGATAAFRMRVVGADDETGPLRRGVVGNTLAEVEHAHILAALERNDWNQHRTAEELGIHRNTLRNKIQEYGLKRRGT
jgi:transcriptional regulator with GAF, ATPase, and Fis domain